MIDGDQGGGKREVGISARESGQDSDCEIGNIFKGSDTLLECLTSKVVINC